MRMKMRKITTSLPSSSFNKLMLHSRKIAMMRPCFRTLLSQTIARKRIGPRNLSLRILGYHSPLPTCSDYQSMTQKWVGVSSVMNSLGTFQMERGVPRPPQLKMGDLAVLPDLLSGTQIMTSGTLIMTCRLL